MPMFPDSGVPAGEAKNTLPEVTSVPCDELWYSTSRCQPRFDPAAANAMLAEDMNVVIRGEVQYDCLKLDNIERAIRYINQRGLPRSAILDGGNEYRTALDPIATRINNLMTLSVQVNQDNTGPVTLLTDTFGPHPILRDDGQPVQGLDLRKNRPFEIIHWAGNWYVVGPVNSQIPKLGGALSGWIRTDGMDDPSHDGLENTPQSAWKTIQYAYNVLASRYFPTPLTTMMLMLGVPGSYMGADVGPYGGTVTIVGDRNNPAAYKITSKVFANQGTCISAQSLTLGLVGVDLVADIPVTGNWANLRIRDATVHVTSVDFDMNVNVPNGAFVISEGAGSWGPNNILNFRGNGMTMNMGIAANGARFEGANIPGTSMNFSNCIFTRAGVVSSQLSTMQFPVVVVTSSGCTGVRHMVTDNSIILAAGQTMPGSLPGVVYDNGIYYP